MAHAPTFDVTVDEWDARGKAPKAISGTCLKCETKFHATAGTRAAAGVFATYLGAVHVHCPRCAAEGPVQLRRLKKNG